MLITDLNFKLTLLRAPYNETFNNRKNSHVFTALNLKVVTLTQRQDQHVKVPSSVFCGVSQLSGKCSHTNLTASDIRTRCSLLNHHEMQQ